MLTELTHLHMKLRLKVSLEKDVQIYEFFFLCIQKEQEIFFEKIFGIETECICFWK